jgi:hypothetical protein
MPPCPRRRPVLRTSLFVFLLPALLLPPGAGLTAPSSRGAAGTKAAAGFDSDARKAGHAAPTSLTESYGKLPLSFEANEGQTDRRVRFLARGGGYALFLTPAGAVLRLRGGAPPARPARTKTGSDVLSMRFAGANPSPSMEGEGVLPGVSNYFVGQDPAKWRTGIPHYQAVRYAEVYPGVDVLFYGNQRELEYDIVVAPGADPRRVRLAFDGARGLSVDEHGDLTIRTATGRLTHRKPLTYQEVEGRKQVIASRYVLKAGKQIGFEVSAYDPTRPLVIDPVLVYSTYLGGSGQDLGYGLAVDSSGSAYVTGHTASLNFPITAGAPQTAYGGSFADVFVTKLNPAGDALVYSTYLGGSNGDEGKGIAVDTSGSAYVVGNSRSANFPTTPGAFQTAPAGGPNLGDAFAAKLSPAGDALVYSTFLGGSHDDRAQGVALDAAGRAFVSGSTVSSNFPLFNQFQGYPGDGNSNCFVTRLNAAGSALTYSTYLGGSAGEFNGGIAVDSTGKAYVSGSTTSADFPTVNAFQPGLSGARDVFVAKIDADQAGAPSLVYSTYFGGLSVDEASAVAVNSSGNAFVAGFTDSTNFPTTAGAFQTVYGGGFFEAFVAKLGVAGNTLDYSTYLGGSDGDLAYGLALDASGNAYVAGETYSYNFPTAYPFQPANSLPPDAFVTKLDAAGSSIVYSSYLGGGSNDTARAVAVDAADNAYVAGHTFSTNFPAVGPAQGSYGGNGDAFVAKIDGTINDADADGVADGTDNCPLVPNAVQADADGDADGDACDACPFDSANDGDGDGVCGDADNCPASANPDQTDTDGDLVGDGCDGDDDNDGIADGGDNCPLAPNFSQADADGDTQGDACDPDDDSDGVTDASDNCQFSANANQSNNDGDAQGDVCDADDDNDGVADTADNCQFVANADQADADGDGAGDACDTDDDNDGVPDGSDLCPGTPAGTPVNGAGCPLVPANKEQCKKGGWQALFRPDGSPFKNEGDCVQYVLTGK